MGTPTAPEHDPGDPAFQTLYDSYYRPVLAYCRRRAAAADAQDAAARVFEIAWRRFAELPSPDRQLPWLYGVAYRVLSHQWRSSRRRSRLGTRLATLRTPGPPAPDAQVIEREDYSLVRAAAARLPPLDQEVIRLVMWEELSHQQVAAVIGSTVPAAKQRFHRAKSRLAREYARLGGSPIAREGGGS